MIKTAQKSKISTLLLPTSPTKRRRIWEIDFLRGVCIILMVVDHFMFDASVLDTIAPSLAYDDNFLARLCEFAYYRFWFSNYRMAFRIVVVGLFLTLSGISCALSKNNLVRAIKLFLAAEIMTVATVLVENVFDFTDVAIYVGILHCLAFSVFIYCAIVATNKKSGHLACLIIGLYIVIWGILLDYYNLDQTLPKPSNFGEWLEVVFGYRYYGADCFGIIPYTGLFLMGAYGGKHLYADKTTKLPRLYGKWQKPVSFVGRNTLWVYLLHQPVLIAVFAILLLAYGYKLF